MTSDFTFSFPIWTVVKKEDPTDTYLIQAGGRIVYPVFTDPDAALDFVQSLGSDSHLTLPMPPEQLKEVLINLEEKGIEHIGLNPGQGKLAIGNVKDLIDAL